MTRKNAVSLILAGVLALAILTGFAAAPAAGHGLAAAESRSGVRYADILSTPTPTPGVSPDTGVSGGGNGGGWTNPQSAVWLARE